ncbi:MAG: hypothetical protein AB1410_04630 [Acidobacteriota bacterium]
MKKIDKLFPLLLILASISCVETAKIEIEIPSKPKYDIPKFNHLWFGDFRVNETIENHNLSEEITSYMQNEIKSRFSIDSKKGNKIDWEKEKNLFENDNFWRKYVQDKEDILIITGSASLKLENRNIIQDVSPYISPTSQEKRLVPMKFLILNLDLYIINPKTGEIIYRNNFKEEKGFSEKTQSPLFGFFDIMEKITEKFFSDIFEKKIKKERILFQ